MSPLPRGQIDGKFFRWRGARFRARGITYGPFRPDEEETHFPPVDQVRDDFAAMTEVGINSVRVYHPPPPYLYEAALEHNLALLIDIPWPKHLCFLDSGELQRQARRAIREAVRAGRSYDSTFAYSIGNEIPPNIVRWHGAKRVERFLKELFDVAKNEDPEGLFTYANYPSTEYLQLPFLDFVSFNVYLHDDNAFSSYLLRLQNLCGDRPLVLSELGMDTLRHTQAEQATFLESHLKSSYLLGLGGAYVFSWTDEWFTGGFDIEDWAFGITTKERTPKASLEKVRQLFTTPLSQLLSSAPKVSVVVCSYNGASTLKPCLEALERVEYPDYEVLLIDDGSTDNTKEIAEQFPSVQSIHQKNHGLSVARNVGLKLAKGSIVAYTDSDCFVDPDWLTLLVAQLERTGAVGVGGPNLTPADGWMASCVSLSPGQPTHVLEDDLNAEHVPGCNMAFYREALLSIGGFHPQYKKAGDDVDVCWRLQHAGHWISFAPSAFVWHQRRQTPKAYLRQQKGYGEAEALLWYDHPHKFNRRGESMWRGAIYGGTSFAFSKSVIYRGTFCSGMFQTLYQPSTPYWVSIATSLEWHIICLFSLFAFSSVALHLFVLLLAVPPALALVRAFSLSLPKEHDGVESRLLISLLTYLQPLVRSWSRYKKKLLTPIAPSDDTTEEEKTLGVMRACVLEYWDEKWRERTELLEHAVRAWEEKGWVVKLDTGWSEHDVEIYGDIWSVLRICTVQEDHGSGKRLIRARFSIRPSHYSEALFLVVLFCVIGALTMSILPPALFGALITLALAWRLLAAHKKSSRAIALFDTTAKGMGMLPIESSTSRDDESSNDIISRDEKIQ